MSIEIRMPALSPTMEVGTLARWLVEVGSQVRSGDLLAEIETDKATMEFEATEEGTIAQLLIPAGSDGIRVGAAIAMMAEQTGSVAPAGGEVAAPVPAPLAPEPRPSNPDKPASRERTDGPGPCRIRRRPGTGEAIGRHPGEPAGTPLGAADRKRPGGD